jgi:hypothetical protein
MDAQDYTPGKSGQEGTCASARISIIFSSCSVINTMIKSIHLGDHVERGYLLQEDVGHVRRRAEGHRECVRARSLAWLPTQRSRRYVAFSSDSQNASAGQ